MASSGSVFADAAAQAGAAVMGTIAGERTNSQNKDIWKKTQDWQTNMANTAYQRSVADMKAAGLNPILAATKGLSPGSAPGGSTGAPMQSTAASAIQAAVALSQIKLNQANAANATVNAANAATETGLRTTIAANAAKGVDAMNSVATSLPTLIGGWLYKANQMISSTDADKKFSGITSQHSARVGSMSFKELKAAGYVK